MTLVNLPQNIFDCQNLIAGKFQKPSGEKVSVSSPYTRGVISETYNSLPQDISAAIKGAVAAFPAWRETPIKERTQILLKFRELCLSNLEELGHSAAAEAGKTVSEAIAEVLKGIEIVEFAASIQNMDRGGLLEVSRGVTCEYRREPLGVVCGIVPFNFPAMVPMWMFPIAVTLGNCFILKPSEKVPRTACLLGKLMLEAGYPAGVFSLVHGAQETVENLISQPEVKAVGFVGSTPAAKSVYVTATSHGKRALCLGGAKNHLIIVPDADPEMTVEGVVGSFTGCAGQRCMAASLLVAVGNVDHLIAKIKDRASSIKLGSEMGAIINRSSVEKLYAAISRAESEGAKIILDGRSAKPPVGYEGGNWLGPTIIDNAKPGMECSTQELFGPVLTITRVSNLEEALELDKSNPYGNAVSVFTTSGWVAKKVASQAGAGMIGVNVGVPVPREPFSFGGSRSSKFGVGDITGDGGIELWSDRKKITTKWSVQHDKSWMS